MKTTILAALCGLALLAAGCVQTEGGGHTAAVPFIKDTNEARYDRPLEQVYTAARDVLMSNGTLVRDSTILGQTNSIGNIVRALQGTVNDRRVWIKLSQSQPQVTDVAVQVRTSAGGTDYDLACNLNTQIALKLVR